MARLMLFHHILGLTPGIEAFADELRRAGHFVHVPDLFDGKVFSDIDEGVAFVDAVGLDALTRRADDAAGIHGRGIVYSGVSFGVIQAQRLAQTRHGAGGALLLEACLPVADFGEAWPTGVPVQIHGMDGDPFFAGEGDLDAARDLATSTESAELFTYEGDSHLFSDSSLPSYDHPAATLLLRRIVEFLGRLDQQGGLA